MYCDECGYWHYTTYWDRLWGMYLCDYCWADLEDAYYAELTRYDYGYHYYGSSYPYAWYL